MDPVNGGPCQGIRNSIPAQNKLGILTEVLSFDSPESEYIKWDEFITHAIGPATGPYAYCSKLKNWVEENISRFHVVIIHGVWLYNSFGFFYYWKRFKKVNPHAPKIFLMPHGMLDPYFQKAPGRKLKALRNLLFWNLFEKKVINGIDGLLFTCGQELVLARKTFRSYHPRAELNIGYGIQQPPIYIQRFKDRFLSRCPSVDGRPYWLFLSRIHEKKGVDLMLRAYNKLKTLKNNLPDLVIAGPGMETAYGQSLLKLRSGNSVYFTGMLEGEEKWGAFYGCEAFILPSHQENFGIAVVEAMACKKPVLISNQVNIWREIQEGNGGLICEDTEAGISQMLSHWITFTKEKQKEIGCQAEKIYKSKFTPECSAKCMVEAVTN